MRHHRPVLVAAAAAALLLTGSSTALAQTTPPPTAGPGSPTCVDRQAELEASIIAVVGADGLAPDVFPGNTVPDVEDVTTAVLQAVLSDPDLGGGGRALVQAAIGAFADRDRACAPPPATTTPAPPPATTTPTPAPTTTPAPTDDGDDEPEPPVVVVPPPSLDADVDVDVDVNGGLGSVGGIPSGGVQTGGGSMATVTVE